MCRICTNRIVYILIILFLHNWIDQFHPQNLLIGTVSIMDCEVLFPTSFDAVTLNLNKLQPVPSGSGYDSVSVMLKTSEIFDVRFVICKW